LLGAAIGTAAGVLVAGSLTYCTGGANFPLSGTEVAVFAGLGASIGGAIGAIVDNLPTSMNASNEGQQSAPPANNGENENTSSKSGGRSSSDLKPDPKAEAAHTTFKTDKNGNVTNHATWEPNSQNPSGFDLKQRTDVKGGSHFDKGTQTDVSTPHTHTNTGVRPAKPEELPKQN